MSRAHRTLIWRSTASLSIVALVSGCQDYSSLSKPIASNAAAEVEQKRTRRQVESIVKELKKSELTPPLMAMTLPFAGPTFPAPPPAPTNPLPEENPEISLPEAPEPIVAALDAVELSRLFQSSDSTDAEHFLGKRVELTGYVLQVRNLGPQRLVVLGDEHFASALPVDRVLCHIEQDMSESGSITSPRLRISGKCQLGYGNLVVLRDCKIEEELPALEGYEERKAAFAELENEKAIADLDIALEGPSDHLTAKLNVSHFTEGKIDPAVLRQLAQINGLRGLVLSSMPISNEGLLEVRFLDQLHEITLDGTRITADGLRAFEGATGLRSILLDGTMQDDGFAHLASCTNLQSLTLNANHGRSQFSQVAAQHLAAIRSLKHLTLDGARLNPEVMNWIAAQSDLESLSLEHTSVNFDQLRRLAALSSLESLSLSNSTLDDDAALAISSLTNLSNLDLSYTKITDAGLVNLSPLRQIKKLDLSGCAVVGGGLASLQGSTIESLSLWGTKADNEAMLAIESLTSLKKLRLGQTRVGNSALSRLAALQQLEQLELTGIRLNREALPVLTALASLKVLRLSENPFDDCDACLAELSQARPEINLFLGRFDYLAQAVNPTP